MSAAERLLKAQKVCNFMKRSPEPYVTRALNKLVAAGGSRCAASSRLRLHVSAQYGLHQRPGADGTDFIHGIARARYRFRVFKPRQSSERAQLRRSASPHARRRPRRDAGRPTTSVKRSRVRSERYVRTCLININTSCVCVIIQDALFTERKVHQMSAWTCALTHLAKTSLPSVNAFCVASLDFPTLIKCP